MEGRRLLSLLFFIVYRQPFLLSSAHCTMYIVSLPPHEEKAETIIHGREVVSHFLLVDFLFVDDSGESRIFVVMHQGCCKSKRQIDLFTDGVLGVLVLLTKPLILCRRWSWGKVHFSRKRQWKSYILLALRKRAFNSDILSHDEHKHYSSLTLMTCNGK